MSTYSWAVKEAAYKALNPVVIPTWKELTYQGFGEVSGFRKPELVYNPIVPEDSKKIGRMHVSVSHDGEYVIASVLVENPGEVSS
jgi:holo-[acyl-carrier protein] synthase